MSGATIGGVVGGVIGFVVSGYNPYGFQIGFMIGAGVGGYLKPDVIKGPRIGDNKAQLTSELAFRNIVLGTATVMGNVIQAGDVVPIKKKESAGKGGPEIETEVLLRTFAVRIGEPVDAVSRIWFDEKLVADWRDPAQWPEEADAIRKMAADSAKLLTQLTIYYGDEEQLPDPVLEALPLANGGGVGNVPAHRGTSYLVFDQLDVTSRQGSVPQIKVEVVSNGTTQVTPVTKYAPVDYSRFTNDPNSPFTNPLTDYTVVEATGNKLSGGGFSASLPDTVEGVINQAAICFPAWGPADVRVGIMRGGSGPYSPSNSDGMEGHGPFHDMTKYREAWLLQSWAAPIAYQDNVRSIGDSFGSKANTGGSWNSDCAGVVFRSYTSHDSTTANFAGNFEGFTPFSIRLQCKRLVPQDRAQYGEFELPDMPGYVSDTSGNIRKLGGVGVLTAGTFKALALENSGTTYVTRELGPILPSTDPNYNSQAYWDAAYALAVTAGTMPAGMTYSATGSGGTNTYPRNKTGGAYLMTTDEVRAVNQGSVLLSDIVLELASRVKLTPDQLDVSQLTDEVRGFKLEKQMSAADAWRSLQQGYFFDMPEWGNYNESHVKLRAIKRGGATLFNITDDDLTADNDEKESRQQAVEFPRKLYLAIIDRDAQYNVTKVPAERRTQDVRAVGEATVELPIVMRKSEAAPKAMMALKTAWTEAEGRVELKLPPEFLALTPSDTFTYNGKRWRAEQTVEDDGVTTVKAVRDRASNYQSNATADNSTPPAPPVSSIRGPTMFAGMNLPRLASNHVGPGLYVGLCGLMDGWAGCDLMLSVDDGATYQKVLEAYNETTMGTLVNDVAASGEPVTVAIYPHGQLDSVTDEQIQLRQNAFALVTNGVSEVGQFRDATLTATEDQYDLTTVYRGELGTTAAPHYAGDKFVLLDTNIYFVPVDVAYAGKVLKFKPVSRGTAEANTTVYDVLYLPKFTGAAVVDTYVDDVGSAYVDENGSPYYSSEV